jgi:hypothetical protein
LNPPHASEPSKTLRFVGGDGTQPAGRIVRTLVLAVFSIPAGRLFELA